jgi:hypothetical protein
MVESLKEQLELHGLNGVLRQSEVCSTTPSERRRLRDNAIACHTALSELPGADDILFMHSVLCQTFLPHSRPKDNHAVWVRSAGRASLMIAPGVLDDEVKRAKRGPGGEADTSLYVGVPYGAKARLILLYLQSEGLRSREVHMGKTMSAWIRSLGLPVSGGPRGTISAISEQMVRIGRCGFTIQFDEVSSGPRTIVKDRRLVEGLAFVRDPTDGRHLWPETVVLDRDFFEHLREYAVPLDRRAIAHLKDNSLGLDLYVMFAHRLHKLSEPKHLRWLHLQSQLGTSQKDANLLARRIREALPSVLNVYPEANIEVTRHGLLLKPSRPSVPGKTVIQGARIASLL